MLNPAKRSTNSIDLSFTGAAYYIIRSIFVSCPAWPWPLSRCNPPRSSTTLPRAVHWRTSEYASMPQVWRQEQTLTPRTWHAWAVRKGCDGTSSLCRSSDSTWMGMLFGNLFSLTNGGLAGTIWVYFVSWLCTFSLAASLAEMASMAPTSGGQYREFGEHSLSDCAIDDG